MANEKNKQQPDNNGSDAGDNVEPEKKKSVIIISTSHTVDEVEYKSGKENKISYIRHGVNKVPEDLLQSNIVKIRLKSGRYRIRQEEQKEKPQEGNK